MSDLDAALAAYGDSMRRAHRPVDPRQIITADRGRSADGGDRRWHLLLASAACLALLLGTVMWVRSTSASDPSPLYVGGAPGATLGTAAPATNCIPVDTFQPAANGMTTGSVAVTNPPRIDPEDEQPRHALDVHTSPDGRRTLTITFVPAGDESVLRDLPCGFRPFDRPMLAIQGNQPGIFYPLFVDPHEGPPDTLVAGRGSTSNTDTMLVMFQVQPQVASLQIEVRQEDGTIATETFVPQRGWSFVLIDHKEDVSSDLRAYDEAGNLLGTVDRRLVA